MIACAIPPIHGFGTTVTLCGMAFASVSADPTSASLGFNAQLRRLLFGWLVASAGLLLSGCISFILLRRVLAQLHVHWSTLNQIKSDHRFRALQEAVRRRGLIMAMLARCS